MKELKGLIYDMQRFAIHDGSGIRTLIYMKGCPLRCLWCSSPQTLKPSPEILYIELHCKKCGHCSEICPVGAITVAKEAGVKINRELCTVCGKCVEECPNQALRLIGNYVSVEELFQDIKKDFPFYRRSNGGVTVGGGEPTMQYKFVIEILKKCKHQYIDTAIETSGFVKWEHFEKLLEYLDLVHIDVKNMDPVIHRRLTGVSNKTILENARRVATVRPVIIRIPIVPGYNDSRENISATAGFAARLGRNLKRIELLPYHKFGTQTYSRLGEEYKLKDVEPPSNEHMQKLKEIVESYGLEVQIGG